MIPVPLAAILAVPALADCAMLWVGQVQYTRFKEEQSVGHPLPTCTEHGFTAFEFSLAPGSGMHGHLGVC